MQNKLSLLQQELSICEKQEIDLLKQLDLNKAQAYSNYKEALNQLGRDSDKAKVIVAQKYMLSVFQSSLTPSKKYDPSLSPSQVYNSSYSKSKIKYSLYYTGIKLAHKLSQLSSDINSTKTDINETLKLQEWYLRS